MGARLLFLLALAVGAPPALADQGQCLDDVLSSVRNIAANGRAFSIHDTDRLLPQDSSYTFSIDQDALGKAMRELKVGAVREMVLRGINSHFQGIQRIARKGRDYLVISGLTRFPEPVPQLIVARIVREGTAANGSAPTLSGGGKVTEIRIVGTIKIDSRYPHPGGMQLLGDLLLVGLQRHGRGPSEILAFDFSDPEHPRQLPLRMDRPQKGASAVGWTKILSGNYRGRSLIAVVGESHQGVDFYLSQAEASDDFTCDPYAGGRRTRNPNGGFLELSTREVLEKTDLFGANDLPYQNISLITQCDGGIFLLGTVSDRGITVDMSPLLSRGEKMLLELDHLIGEHPEARDVPVPRDNWLDVFRLELPALTPEAGDEFSLSHLLRVRMFPSKFNYDYARRYLITDISETNLFNVNFDAATGFYVHDARRISLYSTKYFAAPRDAENSVERIDFDEFPAGW